ncbi:MAG: hypothetical protein IPM69_08945 [Ignavibacteria bacterium]|nr:hypothetical protein [Ignavibacteria bacterium]
MQLSLGIRSTIFTTKQNIPYIYAVSWSPDGSKLATANSDSTATIFSAATGEILSTFREHNDIVKGVSWFGWNKISNSSADQTAVVWSSTRAKKN